MVDIKRERALYVVGHTLGRNAKKAGHKTAYAYLAALTKQYDVDLLVLCNSNEVHELNVEGINIGTLQVVTQSRWSKLVGVLCGALTGIPPRFATRWTFGAARSVRALLQAGDYSQVWLEFHQTFWVSSLIARSTTRNCSIIMSSHDIVSQIVARRSSLERILSLGWTYGYERNVLQRADKVRVQSTKDLQLLEAFFDVRGAEVAAPALSDFVFSIKRAARGIRPRSLLFWGAMDRSENYLAVLKFAELVLPELIARFPDTTLAVVGSNPPAKLRALASNAIEITGFIDDPSPYFERSSIGVVPLIAGAGIKVKTLEMLRAGIPVVSTPIGAEGIPHSEKLVVVDLPGMAQEIIRLWESKAKP